MGAGVLRGARPAFFLLLLLARSASCAPLWEERQWLRLLHYKPRLLGPARSDARDAGFFLHPDGARDPRAELEALRASFDDDSPSPKDPARCAFPARTAWLAPRVGRDAAALLAPCREFHDWARLMDAGGVSLIFASAYLNNPSSMFGHTFLRMERSALKDDARLLDHTLNFAAETEETSGVLFAFRGLFGLYPGKYSAAPYYYKVQEYGNIEFRDLWEYRLALSTAEVEALVAHAWEMGRAVFPYYFLSKNCSYQLMPALEAAAPRLELMPGSPPVVGPVDTLLAVLGSPDLLKERVYRPSHATILRQRRAMLSPRERRAAWAYAAGRPEEGDRLSAGFPGPRTALTLDAAQDLILYRHGFRPDPPQAVRDLERPVLLRRGRVAEDPPAVPHPSWAFPPEDGHLRRRLTFGAGARRGGAFGELGWRPGLHGFADRSRGYLPGNAIESFSWRLRYDGPSERVYLKELRLIDIVSLTPFDGWTRKPSWMLSTGLDTAFEKERVPSDSMVYDGALATGLTLGTGDALLSVLASGEFAAGAVLRDGGRMGGGLRMVAAGDSGPWRGILEGGLSGFFLGDRTPRHRLKAALNYSFSRDRALRAEFMMVGPHREAMLNAVLHH